MELRHNQVFRPRNSVQWTRERVGKLARPEIEQLRANAGSLGEDQVVALCDDALRERP